MAADAVVKSLLKDDDSTTTRLKNNTHLQIYPTSCGIHLETRGDVNKQSYKDEDDLCHTPVMPHGWTREVRQRKAGKTAGKLDVYITR